MINKILAANLGSPEHLGDAREAKLEQVISQTSVEERESLYAAARYYYSGEGDIFDVGCAAGGSSYCLALGVMDSSVENKSARVHCFDLFDGYSLESFKRRITRDDFDSDLSLFHFITNEVQSVVVPHTLDLVTEFAAHGKNRGVEIAHIDAAKSLPLWKAIFSNLARCIIPGKTLWIFQDFERVRLPWQIYSLDALLNDGEFLGVSEYGTPYFRFSSVPNRGVVEKIATDGFTLDEKISGVQNIFSLMREQFSGSFNHDWPISDLMDGVVAYCHYYAGDVATAREVFSRTSKNFRQYSANLVYSNELGLDVPT